MRTRSFLAIACLASALTLGESACAGEAIFEDPAFDHGDDEAAFKAILASIDSDRTDPRVPILLSELARRWDMVKDGRRRTYEAIRDADSAGQGATPQAPAWTLDWLQSTLAASSLSVGGTREARAVQARRGFLGEFLVVGPFGVVRNASLEDAFEPEIAANEAQPDPKQTFSALREARRWRVLKRDARRSSLSLGQALTGDGSVAYAMTHVRFDAAQEVVFVYRGPSAKIWVNRSLVTTIDRSGERLDPILRVPTRFRGGWNRVLVKLIGGASATFSLQLRSRDGRPIQQADALGQGGFACSSQVQPVRVGDAESEPPLPSWYLERLAMEPTPQRRALYARGLLQSGRGEEAMTVLEDLQGAEPALREQAWFFRLYGQSIEQAENLPSAVRRERARSAYRRVLELDPKSVGARQRLAKFAIDDDRVTEGIVTLEAILADAPGHTRTRLSLVAALEGQGWTVEAERELDKADEVLVGVLRAKSSFFARRGRAAEAQALREKLLLLDRAQTWVLLQRLERALAKGNAKAAYAALQAYQAEAGPTASEVASRRARVARAFGDSDAEVAALRAGVEAKPFDIARRLLLANRLAEQVEVEPAARDEARALLGEVLQARPGAAGARALRDALVGEEDRFWEEWEPDLQEVLRGAPDASHWPKASTVCLFDQQVTRIYPDTSSVDVVHQVWRLLDEGGIERYGSRPQSGETLEIRTITAEGEVLEPIRAGGGAFQMPGLAAGAVVEHAFRTRAGAPAFQYTNGAFYFQDPDLTEPFWLSRWVIMIHKDAPVAVIERNMRRKGISKTVERRGDWTVYIYTAKNQPRIQPEPNAPPRDEFLPWVKIVERRSLEQIGGYYRERATGRATTPSIARRAAALVFGLTTVTERARALYDFVQDHVSRESGGVSAEQILAARGGSKTTLLLGLLQAARVPHKLLLAAPQPVESIDWENPELGQFNAPVLRIDAEDGPLYVFAEGHRLAPFAHLPSALWGSPAYVCDPSGGALELIPGEPATAYAMRSVLELTLLSGGSARARVRRVLPSYGLYRLKEVFGALPEQQVRGWFSQQANQIFPGAKVTQSELPRREEAGFPLTIEFAFEADRVVRSRGDGRLELRGVVSPSQLKARFGAHRQRVFDLILRDLWSSGGSTHNQIRLDLGPYACPRLPRSVTIKNRFGQFSLVYAREGAARVRIEQRVQLEAGRITPANYPAFRQFLERIDQAERAPLVLEERTH